MFPYKKSRKKREVLESTVRANVLKRLQHFQAALKGRFFYFPYPGARHGMAGIPDYLVVLDGRFIGFEVKRPSGVQSDKQKQAEKRIEAAGGIYCVVRAGGI